MHPGPLRGRSIYPAQLLLIACVWLACACAYALPASQTSTVTSPARHVRVVVSSDPLTYQVFLDGAAVLLPSPLGLEFSGQQPMRGLRITGQNAVKGDRTWTPVWGKASRIRDHFNEEDLQFQESQAPFRRIGLEVRCYEDAVAFRYMIPAQTEIKDFTLTRESTGFQPPAGAVLWAANLKNFHSSYEAEYPRRKLSDVPTTDLLALPALLEPSPGLWAAITEADLTDWAGMYLSRNGNTLAATLSPRRDGDGLVKSQAPRHSPWRVLMVARTPAALIESNIIENLSDPSKIEDVSWIKPGFMAWDHWWSGDVEMTNAANERFIDFAAHMGFPYQLVDWQWYGPYNKPTVDITHPAPQLNMPALLNYAAKRHVRLWLWIHSGDVDRALSAGTLDAAFATYERWGIAGVKIDFMNSDDQERVRWYQDIVRRAADHHLMVDFHGAFKPTGLDVTWPNLLTREGVLGNEYNKFSTRVTPTHKATIPFTRGLAGPMDYTPGGFLNRSQAEFHVGVPTEVMGSRANELALFVVYWSPLTCITDDPAHYIVDGKEQPGLAFLRDLPTVWDETRALDGAVGEHVIVARRKGRDWYLGGITADHPYTMRLPLTFLGKGRFVAHLYQDPEDPAAPYTALEQKTTDISARDQLTLQMRPAGGVAIRFQRVADTPGVR